MHRSTLLLLLTVALASAQDSAPCKVGSRLSRAGVLNRSAVIKAIDERKGLYQVKYDNGDLDEWLPPRLFAGCKGVAAAAIPDDYFNGNWSLFIGPTPHYETRGSDRYLVVGSGAKAPPLVVHPDGSYVWTIDSKTTVKGRWRKLNANEMKYGTTAPAILLMKGEDGKDWQISVPKAVGTADTKDRITIERMDMGLSYMGTRIK
jgi:hypothetical protein